MTKSYFNIDKFRIGLGVFAAFCSLAFYSCSIRGYETEEIVEEILDTQKAASTQKFVPSTERYDETAENMYREEQNERSSEVQPTIEKGPFTIQIGAFVKEYRAINLFNSARQTLNTEIYYELINSQYKVRLGEFPTKADAMGTLEKLWNLGFYGAFIAKK